jgi:ankyrin repeat protein
MDISIQFIYSQFINLSPEIQYIYILLAAFLCFVMWQVLTNPLAQIHNAASTGNINLVRKCLEKGIDADLQSGNGVTPLYLAATWNHREIAELLIYYGADINQGLNHEYGRNPLLGAAIANHSELMKLLIDNGAKSGLHMAALDGDIDAVRTFLELQIFTINSNRNQGMLPLHLAAREGHRAVTELLLDSGADINCLKTSSDPPLSQAIKFNRIEVVKLLIDRGADLNFAYALHVATSQNYLEIVKLLIDRGVDINYQGDRKRTPLHIAASEGLVEIAQFLIANGAQVNAKSKFDASTPLHHAAENGFIEVAELLLANGAEIDPHGGSHSCTPLFYASQEGHLLMVSLLIRNGANVNIPDID